MCMISSSGRLPFESPQYDLPFESPQYGLAQTCRDMYRTSAALQQSTLQSWEGNLGTIKTSNDYISAGLNEQMWQKLGFGTASLAALSKYPAANIQFVGGLLDSVFTSWFQKDQNNQKNAADIATHRMSVESPNSKLTASVEACLRIYQEVMRTWWSMFNT